MSENRLNDDSILSIESDLSKSIPYDQVIEEFAVADKNGRIVLEIAMTTELCHNKRTVIQFIKK